MRAGRPRLAGAELARAIGLGRSRSGTSPSSTCAAVGPSSRGARPVDLPARPAHAGRLHRVAEESGLIGESGRFVLAQACRDQRLAASPGGRRDLDLASTSPVDSSATGTTRESSALAGPALPADRRSAEITESLMLDDSDASDVLMRRLRDAAGAPRVDDFGAGYSGLAARGSRSTRSRSTARSSRDWAATRAAAPSSTPRSRSRRRSG